MATICIDAVRLSFAGKDIIDVYMLHSGPRWQWCRKHDWPPSQNFTSPTRVEGRF